MPITFHYRPEAQLMVCVHSGQVPDDEFLTRYTSMLESDRFHTTFNLLIDLRQADSSPRSGKVLRQIAEIAKLKYAGITTRPKVGVIAPRDLSFGLARMYEAFADPIPWEFVVFRSVDSALSWLGAPADLLDELDQDSRVATPPGDEHTPPGEPQS